MGIMENNIENVIMGYVGFMFWGLGSRVQGNHPELYKHLNEGLYPQRKLGFLLTMC